MAGEYGLFTPENEEERKLFGEAEAEMDNLIKQFLTGYKDWGNKYIVLGARDSVVRDEIFAAIRDWEWDLV